MRPHVRQSYECDERIEHTDRVARARAVEADEEAFRRAAERFRLLADPTRLKMLAMLAEQEMCVCDLAAAVGAGQSAVSHQLRLLRAGRSVRCRREGPVVWYALADEGLRRLMGVAFEAGPAGEGEGPARGGGAGR